MDSVMSPTDVRQMGTYHRVCVREGIVGSPRSAPPACGWAGRRCCRPTVVEHIVGKHRAGDSLRTIVSQLNHEGVPTTPRRATWY